jgi:hypothetical protein
MEDQSKIKPAVSDEVLAHGDVSDEVRGEVRDLVGEMVYVTEVLQVAMTCRQIGLVFDLAAERAVFCPRYKLVFWAYCGLAVGVDRKVELSPVVGAGNLVSDLHSSSYSV